MAGQEAQTAYKQTDQTKRKKKNRNFKFNRLKQIEYVRVPRLSCDFKYPIVIDHDGRPDRETNRQLEHFVGCP